jgi:hypothetical protein
MRTCSLAIAFIAAIHCCSPAAADETCFERSHQFGKMRHCVTSVRPPEGAVTFGPDHLAGTDNGTWCAENVTERQTITLYQDPKALIRTINITNGNATSDESLRRNARVESAQIETDRGYKGTIALKDTRAPQKFVIPKGRIAWLRLTILDTYPSKSKFGVCVSEFLVNIEEFANE